MDEHVQHALGPIECQPDKNQAISNDVQSVLISILCRSLTSSRHPPAKGIVTTLVERCLHGHVRQRTYPVFWARVCIYCHGTKVWRYLGESAVGILL